MMNSLYTAATGMSAMQMNVDTIANNLANVNTNAFKAGRMSFEDLLYQQVGDRQAARNGAQSGMGVGPANSQILQSQGELRESDVPTHVAIQGNGFFQVALPDGTLAYTRDGSFQVDANGQLVTQQGYQIEPIIGIPAEADPSSIIINREGLISAVVEGQEEIVGQLEIITFSNPAGLAALGSNTYAATDNSGLPVVNDAGTNGSGFIAHKQLEGSNVAVMTEMVEMINAQRAFESVSKVISASDEMLSIANQMRR